MVPAGFSRIRRLPESGYLVENKPITNKSNLNSHHDFMVDFFQYEKTSVKIEKRPIPFSSQNCKIGILLLTFENILDIIASCKFNLHNKLNHNRNDY